METESLNLRPNNSLIFPLTGKIRYGNSWAWLECPEDVGEYYRAVVKQVWGVKLSTPLNGPHITLIAGKYEYLGAHPLWRAREGEEISFTYTSLAGIGSYWWLPVIDDLSLRAFRSELGINETLKYPFHLTIGKENP